MLVLRLIFVILSTAFLTLTVPAQEQTDRFLDLFSNPEDFDKRVNHDSENTVFKILQFNAPYRGGYYETHLNQNGNVFSERVTQFARQAGRRARLNESQIKEIKQTLSGLIATNCLENLAPQDGEPYAALLYNDGGKVSRCNFTGELPDELRKIKDLLNVEYDKADQKWIAELRAKERLVREKYGDWEKNPQGIRYSVSGFRKLENINTSLLYLKGKRQPVTENSKDIPLYYALVRYPKARVTGGAGGGTFSFDPISRDGISWAVTENSGQPEKQLVIEYNVIDYTVSMESRIFQLKNGNLFVVEFDENWSSRITQFDDLIKEPASEESILAVFGKKIGENLRFVP